MEIKALIVVCLCVALWGCGNKRPKFSDIRIDADSLPVQEFFDSTKMSLTEDNIKIWTLHTTHLKKFRKNGRIYIDPVDVTYYTKEGQSHLVSDSGMISHEMDTLIARSNVSITTSDGRKVTTTHIAWNKQSNKVTSDQFVKMVTKEGDVYSGEGFEANTDLSEWRILRNVKARIHQIDKKMD